jgi:hypothetical protein
VLKAYVFAFTQALAGLGWTDGRNRSMRQAHRQLIDLVEHDPTRCWPKRWQAFLDAGGVSAAELQHWVSEGGTIRSLSSRHHRGCLLRVVNGENFP